MDDSTARLEDLYRRHGPGLLAYLRRRVAPGQAAEDLLQETILQALRRPERLALAASPKAWLFGIARHVALTALRRRRAAPAPLEGDIAAAAPESDDERRERVRAAIAALPAGPREALELRLRHELTYEEIAQVLDVPVGTVRSRLHHAVRRLRDALADAEE